MRLVIWHRDGLTIWSGSIQADLPAVIRPVSFCLKRKPALLRLVILVRHTCWQTGFKAVCHWIQIKLYDMKDFCGRAPVLQYSYTANTYFKKSKSRFHANNRIFLIAVITIERQEKKEVKQDIYIASMSLLKPLMQSETQTEDSWKVSPVLEQLLILKYLHDEMRGKVQSGFFKHFVFRRKIKTGCILKHILLVLLRPWGMMICNLQNRSTDSI